ncbi:MAG: hypothetical protein Q6J78_03550, partial [Thermostichales cyanobacterium SRBZ-1_bins_19]
MNVPTDRTLLDEISQLTEVVRQSRQYFQEQFQQAQTLAATSQAIQHLATTLEQMGGSQTFQELLEIIRGH